MAKAKAKAAEPHGDVTVNLPTALSAEEKRLKELQEKYKEWKKKMAEKKPQNGDKDDGKKGKRTIEELEEATHEIIKKVQSGAITMKKSDDKQQQFKRNRQNSDRHGEEGEIVDPFDDEVELPANVLWQQRRNESSGVVGNGTQRTLYIRGFDLQKETLNSAFSKFGEIKRINLGDRQRHAFIEFTNGTDAETAIKDMDGNMVNGISLRVSFARRQGWDN